MLSFHRVAIACGTLVAWFSVVSPAWPQGFEQLFQRGISFQKAGRPQQAAAAYEAAIRVGGPGDGNYEWAFANLAQCYSSLGKRDAAETLLKQVIARREARLGPDHDDLGKVVGDLGVLYMGDQKYDLAMQYLSRCVKIRSKHHPIESYEVYGPLECMISCAELRGDYKDAETAAERLLKRLEARVGPNDARLRSSLQNVARSQQRNGNYSEAEKSLRRAQHLPAPARWDFADPFSDANALAALYCEMGRFTEALEQYTRAEKAASMTAERIPTFRSQVYGAAQATSALLPGTGPTGKGMRGCLRRCYRTLIVHLRRLLAGSIWPKPTSVLGKRKRRPPFFAN